MKENKKKPKPRPTLGRCVHFWAECKNPALVYSPPINIRSVCAWLGGVKQLRSLFFSCLTPPSLFHTMQHKGSVRLVRQCETVEKSHFSCLIPPKLLHTTQFKGGVRLVRWCKAVEKSHIFVSHRPMIGLDPKGWDFLISVWTAPFIRATCLFENEKTLKFLLPRWCYKYLHRLSNSSFNGDI